MASSSASPSTPSEIASVVIAPRSGLFRAPRGRGHGNRHGRSANAAALDSQVQPLVIWPGLIEGKGSGFVGIVPVQVRREVLRSERTRLQVRAQHLPVPTGVRPVEGRAVDIPRHLQVSVQTGPDRRRHRDDLAVQPLIDLPGDEPAQLKADEPACDHHRQCDQNGRAEQQPARQRGVSSLHAAAVSR